MNYADWNQKLFEHFFNEDQVEKEVLLLVDAPLLKELSDFPTEKAAIDDFVRAIAERNEGEGRKQNVCLKAVQCFKDWNNGDKATTPPFIAYLALFILAWTTAGVNEGLQAGAYYERLNNLLRRGNDSNQVNTPQLMQTNNLWKELEKWSLRQDYLLGQFTARSAGGHEHIGYPLSQALFGEKDRLWLEKLFADLDLDAGRLPSQERMQEILAGSIGHYCNHGAAKLFQNSNLQTPMAAASLAILSRWDGEVEYEGCSGGKRSAALTLRLTLRSQLGDEWKLGGRLFSRSGQFDPDGFSPFVCQGKQYQWLDQHAGWSTQLNEWSPPHDFLAHNTPVALMNGRHVHFSPGDIYAFEENPIVGEYTQTHTVYPARKYLFLVKPCTTKLEQLCNANPGIVIVLANGQPVFDGWQLWQTSGLVDTTTLETLAANTSLWSLSLMGGCRLGRGAEYPVFALPSFVIEGPTAVQAELVVLQNNAVIETKTIRAGEWYDFPDSVADGIQFRAYLRVPQDDNKRLGWPRTFQVIRPKLSEDITSRWASSDAANSRYLYPEESIAIQFTGGTRLKENHFIRFHWGGLPVLQTNPPLGALQLRLDGVVLELQGDGFHLPQNVGFGRHRIYVTWHGVNIRVREPFVELIEPPICKINLQGGRRVMEVDGIELRVVRPAEACCAQIVMDPVSARCGIEVNGIGTELNNNTVPLANSPLPLTYEIKATWKGIEFSRAQVRYQPDPVVIAALQGGEKWPESEWNRSSNPPEIQLESENAPENEIELSCGNAVLKHDGAGLCRFPLAEGHSIVTGIDLPISARWHELDLGELCRVSIVDQPNASLKMEGGRQDAQGRYKYGSGYSVRVHPWDGFYSRAMRVTMGVDGAELPISANGDVNNRALAVGIHELSLYWFDQIVDKLSLTIFKPESIIELVGGARLTEEHDVFLSGHLPAILVDTDEQGVIVTINGNRMEMTNELRVPSPLDDQLVGYGIEEVKMEAFSGGVKIGNRKSFQIVGSSWRRLGCFAGEVAGVDEQPAWITKWFAKRAGRDGWDVYYSSEHEAASLHGNYERQKIKEWNKIVREGALHSGNPEARVQWKKLGGRLA